MYVNDKNERKDQVSNSTCEGRKFAPRPGILDCARATNDRLAIRLIEHRRSGGWRQRTRKEAEFAVRSRGTESARSYMPPCATREERTLMREFFLRDRVAPSVWLFAASSVTLPPSGYIGSASPLTRLGGGRTKHTARMSENEGVETEVAKKAEFFKEEANVYFKSTWSTWARIPRHI